MSDIRYPQPAAPPTAGVSTEEWLQGVPVCPDCGHAPQTATCGYADCTFMVPPHNTCVDETGL